MNTETRKPYTVESYKKGIKAICRNGQEPSEVHYFESSKSSHKMCAVIDGDYTFYPDTGIYNDCGFEQPYDLFEQEDVVETWHNKFHNNDVSCSFKSFEDAKCMGSVAAHVKHILKLTYNPNKPENEQYSVEVVHKY